MTAMHDLGMFRVVIYGPFVLSLLNLLPKAKKFAEAKLADVLSENNKQLVEEVERTVELIAKFESLIEISIFDILYAYLNLLLTLWEFTCPIPKEKVVFGIVALMLYNILLIVLGWKLRADSEKMHYGSLNDVRLRVAGVAIRGRTYLDLYSIFFAFLAAVFTAVSRKVITGEF
jgi:hypothetical protein